MNVDPLLKAGEDPEPTGFPDVTLATWWAIIRAPLVAREVGMRLERAHLRVQAPGESG